MSSLKQYIESLVANWFSVIDLEEELSKINQDIHIRKTDEKLIVTLNETDVFKSKDVAQKKILVKKVTDAVLKYGKLKKISSISIESIHNEFYSQYTLTEANNYKLLGITFFGSPKK